MPDIRFTPPSEYREQKDRERRERSRKLTMRQRIEAAEALAADLQAVLGKARRPSHLKKGGEIHVADDKR